jgi:hypothetical protein
MSLSEKITSASHGPSLPPSKIDLNKIDLNRIKDLLAGREPSKKANSLRAIVNQQMPEIEAALIKGLSLEDITDVLREGGLPLCVGTLRKYVYLSRQEKNRTTGESPSKKKRPPSKPTLNEAPPISDAPAEPSLRRTLSRIKTIQAQQQGSNK